MVPSKVGIEGSGYRSEAEASKAVRDKYLEEMKSRKQEIQLGLIRISVDSNGVENWGWLTPGWGPYKSIIVDFSPLADAYRAAGYDYNSWMHGHWDSQSNFSATDFSLVWETSRNTFLMNRKGEVRMLNDAHLQKAFKKLESSYKRDKLEGLQRWYAQKGLAGDLL